MNKKACMRKLVVLAVLAAASGAFAADQIPAPAAPAAGAPATAEPKKESVPDTAKETLPADAESLINLKVPLFSPRFAQVPVALVNDEPILLSTFVDSLAAVHGQQKEGAEAKAGKKQYLTILDRLINVSLLQQEAERMGLDEQPDAKEQEENYARETLLDLVKRQHLKGLKPDPKLLDQFYKQAAQEWKIKSIKFDKEEDAKEFSRQLQAGGNFDELANKLIDAGKVEGNKEGGFVKPSGLLPHVATVVSGMQPGTVSQIISVGPAFAILKLEEVRHPEGDQEAKAQAMEQAMDVAKSQALARYWSELKKKYAKINDKLLQKIDFDAPKPGFDALLKDKREVARIKGAKIITVGDLAAAVKKKFFHGIAEQVKNKKVDQKKLPVLDEMLYKQIYELEAKSLGIDKTAEYREILKKNHTSLMFGKFIEKVVTPEVKITNDDLKKYYEEHIADFTSPEMVRIVALAFTKKEYAESALVKLRKGAEFQWLKANAEGQADPKSQGLLEFEGNLLMSKNLPDEVRQAVAGAGTGDARLLETREGFSYLLVIPEVIPPKPSTLESNREEIAKNVYNIRMGKAVEEWAAKLRKASNVQVFLTDAANR